MHPHAVQVEVGDLHPHGAGQLFLAQWSLRLECRAIGCIMLVWIIEDYLWFVLNPAYGVAHFNPAHIAWHKHWLWWAPTDYWVSLLLAGVLLWFSYKRKS